MSGLTLEHCIKRLIRKPPALSRIDSTRLVSVLNRLVGAEMIRYRHLLPPQTLIPSSSNAERFAGIAKTMHYIRTIRGEADMLGDLLPSDGDVPSAREADQPIRLYHSATTRYDTPAPPVFSWAGKDIDASLRMMLEEADAAAGAHPPTVQSASSAGGGRFKVTRAPGNLSVVAGTRVGVGSTRKSTIVIETTLSDSLLLHKLSELHDRAYDHRILFPDDPEVAEATAALAKLASAAVLVVSHHSLTPVPARYASSNIRVAAVDAIALPTRWQPFALAARAAVMQPRSGEEVSGAFAESHTEVLRRFRIEMETLLLPADVSVGVGGDGGRGEGSPLQASAKHTFSRERFLSEDRRGSLEDVVEVTGYDLDRGSALPNTVYSTRNLRSLDALALRDVVAYGEVVLEAIRVTSTKIDRYRLSSGAGPQRAGRGIKFEHLRMRQALDGLFTTVALEAYRRLHAAAGRPVAGTADAEASAAEGPTAKAPAMPLTPHDVCLLSRLHVIRPNSSLMFPRRGSLMQPGTVIPVTSCAMLALGDRGFSAECFSQSAASYLYWLLQRIYLPVDSNRLRWLWKARIEGPLAVAASSQWSFSQPPLARHFLSSIVGKGMVAAIAGALRSGWVSPTHLAIHTSYFESRQPGTVWSRIRHDLRTVAIARGHWPLILANVAAAPDASHRNRTICNALGIPQVPETSRWALEGPLRALRPCDRLALHSVRTDIGNGLLMSIFFGSVGLESFIFANLYEAYRDEWAHYDGLHAMVLCALIRCGPLTAEHSAALARLQALAHQRTTAEHIIHENVNNSFGESYGYVCLLAVSYHTPEWLAAHAPQMVGLAAPVGPSVSVTAEGELNTASYMRFFSGIRRSLLFASAAGDSFLVLVVAIFFATFDKWVGHRDELLLWWRDLILVPTKRTLRDTGMLFEFGNGVGFLVAPHRFVINSFALPQVVDIWYQRFHRLLCLHDDSDARLRSLWETLQRPFTFPRGRSRGAATLQQSVQKASERGSYRGVFFTPASSEPQFTMTPASCSSALLMGQCTLAEVAAVHDSPTFARALAGWWASHRGECEASGTLFGRYDVVGGAVHRLSILVCISDRLLRDHLVREDVLGNWGETAAIADVPEGASLFGAPTNGLSDMDDSSDAHVFDDKTEIFEAITGDRSAASVVSALSSAPAATVVDEASVGSRRPFGTPRQQPQQPTKSPSAPAKADLGSFGAPSAQSSKAKPRGPAHRQQEEEGCLADLDGESHLVPETDEADDGQLVASGRHRTHVNCRTTALSPHRQWHSLIRALHRELAGLLADETSPFGVRTPAGTNALLGLPWPRDPYAHGGDVRIFNNDRLFVPLPPQAPLLPMVGSSVRGELVLAAWSCAMELAALGGPAALLTPSESQSRGISHAAAVATVWDAVLMRLAPVTHIDALLAPSAVAADDNSDAKGEASEWWVAMARRVLGCPNAPRVHLLPQALRSRAAAGHIVGLYGKHFAAARRKQTSSSRAQQQLPAAAEGVASEGSPAAAPTAADSVGVHVGLSVRHLQAAGVAASGWYEEYAHRWGAAPAAVMHMRKEKEAAVATDGNSTSRYSTAAVPTTSAGSIHRFDRASSGGGGAAVVGGGAAFKAFDAPLAYAEHKSLIAQQQALVQGHSNNGNSDNGNVSAASPSTCAWALSAPNTQRLRVDPHTGELCLIAAFAAHGLGAVDQISLLGAVARAMLSPSCAAIHPSTRRVFAAHCAELADSLRYAVDAAAEEQLAALLSVVGGKQQQGNNSGAAASCSSSGGVAAAGAFAAAEALLAGPAAGDLADVLAVAFAFGLHLQPSGSHLWLAQRLGLAIETVPRAVSDEMVAKVKVPQPPPRAAAGNATATTTEAAGGGDAAAAALKTEGTEAAPVAKTAAEEVTAAKAGGVGETAAAKTTAAPKSKKSKGKKKGATTESATIAAGDGSQQQPSVAGGKKGKKAKAHESGDAAPNAPTLDAAPTATAAFASTDDFGSSLDDTFE